MAFYDTNTHSEPLMVMLPLLRRFLVTAVLVVTYSGSGEQCLVACHDDDDPLCPARQSDIGEIAYTSQAATFAPTSTPQAITTYGATGSLRDDDAR
jgi:hypothetical protein